MQLCPAWVTVNVVPATVIVPVPCLVIGIKLLLASGRRGFETMPQPSQGMASRFLNVTPVLTPSTIGVGWMVSF